MVKTFFIMPAKAERVPDFYSFGNEEEIPELEFVSRYDIRKFPYIIFRIKETSALIQITLEENAPLIETIDVIANDDTLGKSFAIFKDISGIHLALEKSVHRCLTYEDFEETKSTGDKDRLEIIAKVACGCTRDQSCINILKKANDEGLIPSELWKELNS